MPFKISKIPYRLLTFSFVIWSNSRYAPIGRNAGFYCDDDKIKQQFTGDSIDLSVLLIVLIGIFPLFLYMCQALTVLNNKGEVLRSNFCLLLKIYLTGFLITMGLTEILKLFVGELRPHFYYSCLPDMKNTECSKEYITDFKCTADGPDWLVERDIYKSFPSGHASLSFYSFVFLSIYIPIKLKDVPKTFLAQFLVVCVPAISFLWTLICCVSRIRDNRHFWWDVLFGVGLGLLFGLIYVKHALNVMGNRSKT